MVSDDRGQVLLVGAVALAFILIGLGVLLGSVADTKESVNPGQSIDAADRAATFNYATQRGVRGAVVRMNHLENVTTRTELRERIEDGLRNYSQALARSYASEGVYVNVSLSSVQTWGTRIIQDNSSRKFIAPEYPGVPVSGDKNWTVVSDTEKIGWAIININTSSMPEDDDTPLIIRFETAGGPSSFVKYSITRNGTSVDIKVFNTTGQIGSVTCETERQRAVLDLLNGNSPRTGCTFPSVRQLDGPYDIKIREGDEAKGKYAFVVSKTSVLTNLNSCDSLGSLSYPCNNPAVWTAEIQTTYIGSGTRDISYTITQNVTIYNAAS